MRNSSTKRVKGQYEIDAVEMTSDQLSGRGGLSLFVRYLKNIALNPHLERLFGSLRKSRKGLPVVEVFKQLLCFFVDGTSRHLSHFDSLKEDSGYAGVIEAGQSELLSSHAVKRFLKSFSWFRIWLFRRLLLRLFVWRLGVQRPAVILLGIDTMVMDNGEALKRHGVKPTYKKVKGFQPLQMTWGPFIIDAVFRGGNRHSNHSDTVEKMIRKAVARIRSSYRQDVPIIIRMDSGFFAGRLFDVMEELGVGYQVTSKIYDDVGKFAAQAGPGNWRGLESRQDKWEFIEFGDRRGVWKKFRRAFFCRLVRQDGQQLLEFARPDQVLYTNLGCGDAVDGQLRQAGREDLLEADSIILGYHGRGADELVHRAVKDFSSQTLPFKRFAPNAAFYYIMLVAFFLHECFKQDVCSPTVPVNCYPTTLRRRVLDIAAKIVRHAGRVTLKVPRADWKRLAIDQMWARSAGPPVFSWA